MKWKISLTSPRGGDMHGIVDKAGAALTWVCIVHCLLIPFVLTAIPFWGFSLLTDEKVEWAIISTSVLIAAISFVPAFFYRHRKLRVVLLFAGGIGAIIFAAQFLEEVFLLKAGLLLTGAILVTSSHLINRRLCKDCTCARD